MQRRILVTGAAGFIGSFLCEELISRQHFVIGIDNFFRGKKENLDSLKNQKNFLCEEIDLSQPENIESIHNLILKHNIETIFHLAAINGTQYFYDRPLFVLDQNTRMTQNLLLAIINTPVNYIAYTSSSEAYGDPQVIPTKESEPILLNTFADRDSYAVSKVNGDFYIRLFSKEQHIEFLILRVFNTYGERMIGTRYGQVIPEFVKRMLFENTFTIIGDGSQTRSFCYVKDSTWAMAELLEKKITGILNLGNDYEITILELAKKIHAIKNKEFNPTFLPGRPNDHKRRRPDISQLKSLLPKLTFTDLDTGLKKVILFFEQKSVINKSKDP